MIGGVPETENKEDTRSVSHVDREKPKRAEISNSLAQKNMAKGESWWLKFGGRTKKKNSLCHLVTTVTTPSAPHSQRVSTNDQRLLRFLLLFMVVESDHILSKSLAIAMQCL